MFFRVGVIAMILFAGIILIGKAEAQALDPLVDYRYAGVVVRNADGTIKRSSKVLTAFKKKWACPSTGLHTGACPGWAIDHVVSLACGGLDSVVNLQWLPLDAKSCAADYCKDRWERRVYGGNNMSEGCP